MIKNRNEIPQIKQTIKSGYVKFEATRTTFTAKTFCNYTSTPTSEFEINFCGDGWNPLDDILPALRGVPSKRTESYFYDYFYACYVCTVWMHDMMEYNGTSLYVPLTGFKLSKEFAMEFAL